MRETEREGERQREGEREREREREIRTSLPQDEDGAANVIFNFGAAFHYNLDLREGKFLYQTPCITQDPCLYPTEY